MLQIPFEIAARGFFSEDRSGMDAGLTKKQE